MNKTMILKRTVSTIAGYGAGIITYAIIRNNVDYDELPNHKKVAVTAGGFAIGGVVADAVQTQTDAIIDGILSVKAPSEETPTE